ncbi:MAG: hypothetical protein AMXMBFR61_02910 [Fimbriimonadales bacterium]
MSRIGIRLGLAVAALLVSVCALAQDGWDYEVSIEARVRGEARDNRDFFDASNDRRDDIFGRLRVGFRMFNEEQGVSLFLQPQESYDQYYTPARNDNDHYFDIYQAYAEFQDNTKAWKVRGGRQDVTMGRKRLFGAGYWGNFGRSYDGLRIDYAVTSQVNITAFGGTIGSSGRRPRHPDIGLVFGEWKSKEGPAEVYYIYKHDNLAGISNTVHTFGARAERKLKNGIDFIAEAAFQSGDYGDKSIEAMGAYLTGGYTFQAPWKPRLGFEVTYASGGDPADDKYKTFDQLFAIVHPEYGIADYQGWRNMRALMIDVTAVPAKNWQFRAAHHWFRLDNAKDAWYGSTGGKNSGAGGTYQDPTGAAGKDVGHELDLILTYKPNKAWAAEIGVARFFPGSFIKTINGGSAQNSDWGYLSVTWWY